MMEAKKRSKLEMVKNVMEGGCSARCVQVARKELRQIMTNLRGGTAELKIETGRWIGFKREERMCGTCGLNEVEDVEHFLLRCSRLVRERGKPW